MRRRPQLSVVVAGEAGPHTHASLAPEYQGFEGHEVIAADTAAEGLARARGEVVVVLDGAALLSPGALRDGLGGARMHERAVVAALGWDLDTPVEWPADAGWLYEHAAMSAASVDGWFRPIAGSDCLFATRETWAALGGATDYRSAIGLPGAQPVLLLGAGAFRVSPAPDAGEPVPTAPPLLVGALPAPVLARMTHAVLRPAPGAEPPLGTDFDFTRWTAAAGAPRPEDEIDAALADLLQHELVHGWLTGAAAVAQIMRDRRPQAPGATAVLRRLGARLPATHDDSPEFFIAAGMAYATLGDTREAENHFRAALRYDDDLPEAQVGLSKLALPGPLYREWLEHLYAWLEPATVLEIGVDNGLSLARVPPPAHVIGVDPTPRLTVPPRTRASIFPETSDAFFAARRLAGLIDGPLDIAFIDGLHLYEQALRDFVNVEPHCGPGSVVFLHDTLPLDERTQRRACDTRFHSGDVWKTAVALRRHRPDLDVCTIATAWTGLTLVTGFGDGGAAFADRYDAVVAELIDEPWHADRRAELDVVPNDWDTVIERLRPLRPGR